MPVAEPQLNDRGLPADAHRVVLAGSIEGLQFPPLCPNCAAPAAGPLLVAKVFQYNHGSTDDGGWRYRITRAAPLFCRDCLARHQAEAVPVTGIDRLRSVVFSELAIPAFGTATFALFLLRDMGAKPWRNLPRDWPLLALVAGLLLIAALCLRTAWQNNAHRRVPRQTLTSSAFDFGDNKDSPFQTTARTYALRNADYAAALARLNADRSAALLGPVQRGRETRRFWITAAVIAVIALAARYFGTR